MRKCKINSLFKDVYETGCKMWDEKHAKNTKRHYSLFHPQEADSHSQVRLRKRKETDLSSDSGGESTSAGDSDQEEDGEDSKGNKSKQQRG